MGHMAKTCYKKQNGIKSGKLQQQGNYASSSKQNDDRNEQLFVSHHIVNSMIGDAIECINVWYVDSSASKHMSKIWTSQVMLKQVMILRILLHRLGKCHCLRRMAKRSTFQMYFMF
ncbi:hypothetical protein O6H91_18G028400 [Diphasiastrum complanatum]|uniref:Uncharacterized protein n=1 Tax=Diphasiastrum complanatum TaxID=34168 RepID=A0ACC2AZF8_DIPCM|nr:hypothetical protein O6H91_18G028400 [Diphasiastrum complanatum]